MKRATLPSVRRRLLLWGLVPVGLALLLAGGLALSSSVPGFEVSSDAPLDERIEAVDAWFEELEQAGRFNGAVLIAKNHEPLLMRAYGRTAADSEERLTVHSAFRLASVSKQFTAAGIMVLVEQERLSYEQPVGSIIEGFPYEDVTIRHLLTHTSGVPDGYMKLALQHRSEVGDELSIREATQLVVEAATPPDFAPSERFEYSNTNYVLLAAVVEQVSGQSFERFMAAELFEPLGMQDTRVWNLLSADATFPNKVEGFDRRDGSPVRLGFIDGVAGDGAVFSSVSDFVIWDAFWSENKLIGKDHLVQAFVPPVLNDGTNSNYGFGWGLGDKRMSHRGRWLASNSFIQRDTELGTCIVVLDSSTNPEFEEIVEQLSELDLM